MREALREADAAGREGEVPVGAILVDAAGRIVGRGHNRSIASADPTAHAEILALRQAAGALGNYRLPGSTLYVTVEPCLMCAGAVVWARVARLVFGAAEPKAGAAVSLYQVLGDERLNHTVEVVAGVREAECRDLMQRFFRDRRTGD